MRKIIVSLVLLLAVSNFVVAEVPLNSQKAGSTSVQQSSGAAAPVQGTNSMKTSDQGTQNPQNVQSSQSPQSPQSSQNPQSPQSLQSNQSPQSPQSSQSSTPTLDNSSLVNNKSNSIKINTVYAYSGNAGLGQDITGKIPEIDPFADRGYTKVPDVAMYKNADWSKVIGISRNIPLDVAFQIADKNPEIKFFFYVTGYSMVLELQEGNYRRFGHNDAVFFGGEPQWGSAPGLANGYIKNPKPNKS